VLARVCEQRLTNDPDMPSTNMHLAREVHDPGPRGRGLYIGNTSSLIRASEYLQTLHVILQYV